MTFRTWLDSLNLQRSRTSVQSTRRGARRRQLSSRRLTVEALEVRNMLAAASLRLNDVELIEGNGGTHDVAAIVRLSAPKDHAVTVKYNTVHGTALTSSDFRAVSGKLTFAPGQTSKTIRVPVIGDRLVEPDETFFIKLHDADRAKIADGRGVVTIVDNEPRVSISNVSQLEAMSDTTGFNFTVSQSAAYDQPVTVHYTTTDGSAKAGTDYESATGSLVFAPGETSKTIPVLVTGNRTPEPDKTFSVNVSTPNSYAAIGNGVAVGTIIDGAPRISIGDVCNYNGETSFTFAVNLSVAYDQEVRVNFTTADATAIASVDYVASSGTLVFAPGVTTQAITVNVLDPTAVDKYFTLQLSGASSNAAIANVSAIGYTYYGYYDYGYYDPGYYGYYDPGSYYGY